MAEFIQTFIQSRKIYLEESLHMHMLTLKNPQEHHAHLFRLESLRWKKDLHPQNLRILSC